MCITKFKAVLYTYTYKRFLVEIKRCRDEGMRLLANKLVHIHVQGMEILLAEKVHKQEPRRVAIRFTHATIPT